MLTSWAVGERLAADKRRKGRTRGCGEEGGVGGVRGGEKEEGGGRGGEPVCATACGGREDARAVCG